MDTCLSNLAKVFFKHIYLYGESLLEIDLRNSQPTFLANLLLDIPTTSTNISRSFPLIAVFSTTHPAKDRNLHSGRTETLLSVRALVPATTLTQIQSMWEIESYEDRTNREDFRSFT